MTPRPLPALAALALVLALAPAVVPGPAAAEALPGAHCAPGPPREACREAWVHLRSPGEGFEAATLLAVAPGGGAVFVAGLAAEGGGFGYAAALDPATGAARWDRALPDAEAWPAALAPSPDGATLFVGGERAGPGGDPDAAVWALDAATGAVRWRADLPAPGDASAHALAAAAGGRVVAASGRGLAAWDAATGAPAWAVQDDVWPSVLAASPDGAVVYAAGGTNAASSPPASDYGLAAYDAATGARLWRAAYDGPLRGLDWVYAMVADPQGRSVFATGWSDRTGGHGDVTTVAVDAATGALRWAARYNGPTGYDQWPSGIAASPDGSRVFVAAPTESVQLLPVLDNNVPPWMDYTTLAYDGSTGAPLWEARYRGLLLDNVPEGLVLSPDGARVYVAGASAGLENPGFDSGPYDVVTVAYDAASGGEAWVRRWSGPADATDWVYAIAASPAEPRIFVAGVALGHFFGPAAPSDAMVLAYDDAPAS